MAFERVGDATTYTTASSNTTTLSKPEGVAEGDFLVALFSGYDSQYVSAAPEGWTVLGDEDTYSNLYYKVAGASEPSTYAWTWTTSAKRGGMMVAYRGGFDTADPIDVLSDAAYAVSNYSLTAASVNASAAGAPLIFLGVMYKTSAVTFTPPTGFTEDGYFGNTADDGWKEIASMVKEAAGATGAITATASQYTTEKHAYMIVLNPAAAAPAGAGDLFLDGVWG